LNLVIDLIRERINIKSFADVGDGYDGYYSDDAYDGVSDVRMGDC
jgi:hypothetical protein